MKQFFHGFFHREGHITLAFLIGLAALKVVIHLLSSSNYGYFRDEFYYLAASQRLDFGYVDFPPFIALFTAFIRQALGESLLALRLFPALAGAGVVLLTGLMARQLGANRSGQVLAALAALIAPQFLGANSILTMDSFDMLAWAGVIYLLILIFKYDRPKLWVMVGLVIGIGLTIKLSLLYFSLAMALGLLLTPYRQYFRSPWLYLGGAIALTFLLPYILWNAAHGWLTIEFWSNYGAKVFQPSPLTFVLQQIVIMHPITLPLWLSGLVFFFTRSGSDYRPFGWMYLILLALFTLLGAKNYFLAPFYPVLFAGGTIAMQQFANWRGWRWLGWLRANYLPFLITGGIFIAPMAIPILPLDAHLAYLRVMGGTNPQSEQHESGIFPQNFADRFGWEELAVTMSSVYHSLTPEDQSRACILTGNYGEAGALEFFGARYDLPPVISGHNNYYLWGPGNCTGEVIIYITTTSLEELQRVFSEVQQVAVNQCRYCMFYENNRPIYLCRGMQVPIDQAWSQVKHVE